MIESPELSREQLIVAIQDNLRSQMNKRLDFLDKWRTKASIEDWKELVYIDYIKTCFLESDKIYNRSLPDGRFIVSEAQLKRLSKCDYLLTTLLMNTYIGCIYENSNELEYNFFTALDLVIMSDNSIEENNDVK